MRGVALLGSTGSIGCSALRVLERHAAEFRVVALAAHRNAAGLAEQVERFAPRLAVLSDGGDVAEPRLPAGVPLRRGRAGLIEAATMPEADVVLNAVLGAAGLEATLAALRAGKRLALANKESLVAGGPLVMQALREGGGELVPVDSEHSAILQCLTASGAVRPRRLILTASGGPFREWPPHQLEAATREQALRHPTWEMGAKITVDSATMVNKALEVIEAHFLFGLPYDAIEVVIHPQSIIHSMVEMEDGSVLAQMGFPTMELPILYALTHPQRLQDEGVDRFDPVRAGALTFEPVDAARYPAFGLGIHAAHAGGTAPAAYNAANEVAVAAFLGGRIGFGDIAPLIESVLEGHEVEPVEDLDAVWRADAGARRIATDVVTRSC